MQKCTMHGIRYETAECSLGLQGNELVQRFEKFRYHRLIKDEIKTTIFLAVAKNLMAHKGIEQNLECR